MFTRRRIFIIILGLLVIGLLLIGLRFLFQGKASPSPGTKPNFIGRILGLTPPPPPPTTPPAETPPQGTPPPTPGVPPAEQTLLQLTSFPVISPSLNPKENKILFYKKEGGDLMMSGFNGEEQQKIANLTIIGLIDAQWGPARDRAAVRYLDKDTIKSFLHIGTSTVVLLPQDITSISWSPDKTGLVYTKEDNGKLNVVVTDNKGSNGRVIAAVPLPDAHARWITKNDIELLTAPSGLAEGYAFFLNRKTGNLRKVIGPRFGLLTSWAPDGSGALVFSTRRGGKEPLLEYYDAKRGTLEIVNFITLPEKCAWASAKEIYCAVPRNIGPEQVWPDDYLRGALLTIDARIHYSVNSKAATIVQDNGIFDSNDLRGDKNQKFLFFIDRRDGTLWRIKLKQ